MKILFDLGHTAQLNFYKNAIIELSKSNVVYVTYLDRGRLPMIVKKELGYIENCRLYKIGKHSGTLISVIFETNILRPILLFFLLAKIKPDVEISNGYQAGIYPKFSGIPSIHFNDDPERGKLFIRLMKFFAKEIYVPFYSDEKIQSFKALKEWAYLSPKYFIPCQEELIKYNVKPKEYLFIREVSTKSLSYSKQKSNLIASVAIKIPSNFKVLFSLEDKSKLELYPKDWVLLNEPVEDIHSLMYYSKIVISSGDSMAREGAMLGVPSIYCGIRVMVANNVMINKNMLFHKEVKDVCLFVEKIINHNIEFVEQDKFREELKKDWVDVTELISAKINNIRSV